MSVDRNSLQVDDSGKNSFSPLGQTSDVEDIQVAALAKKGQA